MIKKFAILALAVSAAFSNAFAQSSCTVNISTNNLEFTGKQVKPTIKKVVCGNDEYSEGDFAKVVYGKNINAGTDAGSVTITLTNGNVATKTFDIEPKGVHITVDDVEKELGGETPDLTWTIAEDSELDVLDADTLANFLVALQKELKLVVASGEEQVGTKFKVSKDPSVNLTELFPNYDFLVDPGSLLITKTKIIIIVETTAKVYGEKDPKKFNYEVRGNIVPADYAKLGEIELVRASGEDAGTYTIPVSIDGVVYKPMPAKIEGCELPYCKDTDDYNIYVVYGSFIIQPAAASLTVDDVSKVYGEATPEFTYKVTGLVGEDELKDVTVSCAKCSATGLENVGEYEISASVKAASNPNYKVTTTAGTLTVSKKAATVTVGKFEKSYGDKDPDFFFETDGLVSESEKLELATITRAEGEDVGTYKVSVSFATGSNPNYTLTVVPGTLTINQREVTLAVDNITKKFGQDDPELTYTVEDIAVFGGIADELKGVSLKREAGEDAGEYAITATVDSKLNPNYIIATTDGKLTITANDDKIVVTIKGHTNTVEYNGKEQVLKGFDISSNSEAYDLKFVSYTGDSTVSGTDVGKFNMGLSAEDFKNTSVNYPNVTFNITDGLLQITPKSVVVSAKPATITYGDAIPTEFEWVANGLLEGDELDNIHLSIDKTGILPVGEYPLTFDLQNPSTTNYVVSSYETSTLTVEPKLVTVTVADAQKVYGDPDPESFKYEVAGLLEGDELPALTLGREAGENVLKDSEGQDSAYQISATFVTQPSTNYKVKIRQGSFTILPYPVKITVAIFGEDVVAKYTGEDITVEKKFDVALIPSLDCTLSAEYTYSKDFVSYQGEKTVTAKEMGTYAMGLTVADFVNTSPNFEHVSFVLSTDGNFVIDEFGPEISLAAIKGIQKFGLSSMNRRILVSGSKVGDRYAVHDMRGRVVRSGVVDAVNFEIPVTNAGVYMVRIGSSAGRIRVK